MLICFTEAEEIKMDVQVGPQEEVEAKAENTDTCDRCGNPVDQAKKDPKNVPVGCCVSKEGIKEFYVDAADVIKMAHLSEMDIDEALNAIIDIHEESEMDADNMVIVMSEGTEIYEEVLENCGANCVYFSSFVNEAMDETQEPDINIDVQVGPNGDEMTVSEDPQTANPVDAVKRQYDSVVVAKQGDNFFMDVEDVQKCAELNCESVIDTVNKIIDLNDSNGYDMTTENCVFICGSGASTEAYDELCEAGAIVVFEAKGNSEEARRKKMIKDTGRVIKGFLYNQGCMKVDVSTFYIGGENKSFVKGSGNTVLVGLSSKAANRAAMAQAAGGNYYSSGTDEDKALSGIEAGIKTIKDNKDELISELEDKFSGYKVTNIRVQPGRVGATNVAVTFSKKD